MKYLRKFGADDSVKGSQAMLKTDIALFFENRQKPDFVEVTPPGHGRIETRHILKANRGHWTIENRCHYVIDWNFDEDRSRSRIRTGHSPENITRLRRFAAGVIQVVSDGKPSVSQNLQQLNRNTRLVFDYLRT